jgi:Zn-dependent peptidase ImmA (M78 family)/DNA-binding transcriptional regulator YiaG
MSANRRHNLANIKEKLKERVDNMQVSPTGPNRVELNPVILRWARERRNLSIERVAEHVRKSMEEIESWERGTRIPTVNQARELAQFYERPFLDFLMKEIPTVYEPVSIPDFRRQVSAEHDLSRIEIKEILTWIESMRENAIGLFEETDEQIPEIPTALLAELSESPQTAAQRIRQAIGLNWETQNSMPSGTEYKFPKVLRELFEKSGILTLRNTRLSEFGIRGLSIAELPLPTIVITSEASTAQAFSLAHELGHIAVRASGVSGFQLADPRNSSLEKWCDRFAAEFLLPLNLIIFYFGDVPARPRDSVTDKLLELTAKKFKVSPEVLLIHLVYLKYVHRKYYWDIKRPQFAADAANFRMYGRATYYASRYRSSSGEMYTGLVLEAWSTGKITNHNAAEFLGIKKSGHLSDIRKNFYESA